MPPSPASLRLPERYRVSRHIANGGMAGVWQATDEVLRREVAVKVLAGHLSADETARRRFEREGRAAAGLSGHPNVVTIYDVGEHDGKAFMVMELMAGSVAEALKGAEPIAPERALRWLREAAAALDAAHEAGIVHRDVKPANMLLDRRDRLALADFGIARLGYDEQLTATGVVLGTSSYISPEQALGEGATTASDRYSLSVVAFELLTGTRPFVAEHFAAQARAHIEDAPPAASSRREGLAPTVDAVLARGMAKDPEERWPSAGAFVDALERAMGESGAASSARATPVVASAAAAGPAVRDSAAGAGRAPADATAAQPRPPQEPRAQEPPPGRRPAPGPATATGPRRRWLPVAVAATLLVLAGVATGLALTAGDPDSEQAQSPEATPTQEVEPEPTPTEEPEPEPTPTQEPEPEPTPTQEPEAEPTEAPDPAQAAQLNNEGFALNEAGDYDAAVDPLRRAYELCQGSDQLDPCGYATYNYGVALNRSGDPSAAVPVLEERLDRFGDNDEGEVARELRRARRAAARDGS